MIAIIDSGLGGALVEKQVQKLGQKTLLIQDKANFPYGGKHKDFLISRTSELINQAKEGGCNLVILACNTISAVAYPILYRDSPLPLIDMITPSKNLFRSGQAIGVIGTENTVESGCWQATLPLSYSHSCPQLALAIERHLDEDNMVEIVCDSIKGSQGLDTLILGCTHYVAVKRIIQRLLPETKIFDPAIPMLNKVINFLGGKYVSYNS